MPKNATEPESGEKPDWMPESVWAAMQELNPFQRLGLQGVKNPLGGPPEIPKNTNQENPRRWYVYAHKDESGSIFYVGKGIGSRAWRDNARDRHEYWHRYVDYHLHGKFSVQILIDDLDEDQAETMEDAWMSCLDPDRLINWANYYRTNCGDPEDYSEALKLRAETKELVEDSIQIEKLNLSFAVENYLVALKAIDEYAPIFHESRPTGLIGMIQAEMDRNFGVKGDVIVLDRLTLCLKKLGRGEEAAKIADEYFSKYTYDAKLTQGIAVQKRVNKLIGRKDPDYSLRIDLDTFAR